MVSLSLQNPFSLAACIVEEGAILTLPGVPLIRHLIVEVQWLSEREVALLSLGEDLSIRPVYVRFERLGVHSFGVVFERGDDVVAALTSIDKAAMSDPDSYRQLLQRWREDGAKIPATFQDRAAGFPGADASSRGLLLATSL